MRNMLSHFLIVSLALGPSAACALRPMPDRPGLEETLAPSHPAGLEEATEGPLWDAFKRLLEEAAPALLELINSEQLRQLRRRGNDLAQVREILRGIRFKGLTALLANWLGKNIDEKTYQNIANTVDWFQTCMDPESPRFKIRDWYFSSFQDRFHEIYGQASRKGRVTRRRFLKLVDRTIRPIQPDFHPNGFSPTDRWVNKKVVAGLYRQVINQLLIPRGFYSERTNKGVAYGAMEQVEPDYLTPAGRRVPVYLFTVDPEISADVREAMGYGGAHPDRIRLMRNFEERAAKTLEKNQGYFQKVRETQKISVNVKNPAQIAGLINFLINFWGYSEWAIPTAVVLKRKAALSEEGPHSDTMAFIETLLGDFLSRATDPLLFAEKMKVIVKDPRLLQRLEPDLLLPEKERLKELEDWTDAILELEAWFYSFRDAPVPLEVLESKLAGGALPSFPGAFVLQEHGYPKARLLLAESLTPLLFQKPQATPSEWQQFLFGVVTDRGRFERFNQFLREFGQSQLNQSFLSTAEKEAIHPQPWGYLAGQEEIRFASLQERLGVHGFFLEGEGLPFAALFARAQAQGFPVPFAGVAGRSEMEALQKGLSPEAALLLKERVVVADEIGIKAARLAAEQILSLQVPAEDRASLEIISVTQLQNNLLKQVTRYLQAAGLRFETVQDQRQALQQLRSSA